MRARWEPDRFASLLGRAMSRGGLSQRQLALRAGVAPSVISRWMSGMRPSYENLRQVTGTIAGPTVGLPAFASDLLDAAGYGEPTAPADAPAAVAANWNHPDPRVRSAVREVWGMILMPPANRARWVVEILENTEEERCAGLAGLASIRQ